MFGMCVWRVGNPLPQFSRLATYIASDRLSSVCVCVCVCAYLHVCTELVDTGLVVCRKGMGEDIPPLGAYMFEQSVLSVSHLLLATLL